MSYVTISKPERLHTCDNCDDEVEEVFTVIDCDGDVVEWCEDCVDSHTEPCEYCGSNCEGAIDVLTGYTWRYGREYERWCVRCVDNHATLCEDCDEYASDDVIESYHLWNGGYRDICIACLEDEYVVCECCGRYVHNDDSVYDERTDRTYCPDCYDERHGALQGYGHTSGGTFWFDDGTRKHRYEFTAADRRTMFLGIELETDGNDDAVDLAEDIAHWYTDDELVCKEDGSLDSEGVEIVSQPMTPRRHLDSGMWERVTDMVREHGGSSYDAGTCGLHIHVSRDFFVGHDAVYRLDRLFHRFERQMVRFSRRRDNQMGWCEIDDDTELRETKDVTERKAKWLSKKNMGYRARYQAVNDTNSNTVEIRLWRGSLNMETIRATIEMTTALAIVANAMTDELAETLTWPMLKLLVRFALEQAGLPHDDLDSYLTRRGL